MPQYELNIRDYLRIFRKRRFTIILTFLATTVISVFYLSSQPVIYQASTTVKIEERKTIAGLLTEWIVYSPADVMESQTKLIKGYRVMKNVALRLGLLPAKPSLEEVNSIVGKLQASISAEKIGQTNMIRILATGDTPQEAMSLANAVAEVYIEENLLDKTKQARHARQFIEEQLTSLEARLKDTEERLKDFGNEVKDIKLAEPIEKKLVDLQFELSDLLQKFTEKHPRVIQVRSQIQQMEQDVQGFSGQELQYARLAREVEVNKKLYSMLKEKLEEARITEAQKIGDVSVVDPAMLPGEPISNNKPVGIMVGAMTGLIVGIAFAFLFETLDTSIGTIEDVENTMKLPVLGIVPSATPEFRKEQGLWDRLKERIVPIPKTDQEERFVHLVVHYHPKSLAAEAFRNIRTNLKLDGSRKSLLVTSSNAREGKTMILTNLGIAMAQMGAKVVLVSTDLRRPALAKLFGVSREPGLHELLTGATDLDHTLKNVTDMMLGDMQLEEIINRPPGLENIWILPAGRIPPNPAEILELKKTTEIMEELKRRFDIVLYDTPPVLPVTDASLLAPKVDAVVVVYEIGRTSREALMRTKVQLESVGAKIAGVVLNNTKPQTESATGYPYYYHYKYGYYGREEDEKKQDTQAPQGGTQT